MTKRVAIIGAGCTGLTAIKSCLDEDLAPTCFESSADIGGLWRFNNDVTDGRGCVMSSTVINTSKEMMAFSDFPAPQEFPNFMHHTKVLEYFRLYAKRFSLQEYIQFNTEVLSVKDYKDIKGKKTAKGYNNTAQDKPNDILGKKFNKSFNLNEFMEGNSHCTNSTDSKLIDIDSPETGKSIDGKSNCSDNSIERDTQTACQHHERNGSKPRGNTLFENLSKNCGQNFQSSEITSTYSMRSPEMNGESCNRGWEVKVRDKNSNETSVHHFDCVLVCTGHHADVSMPYFPGQSIFKGRIVHSRDIRQTNEIAGSRHVVVGVGNSGCDAAVELSRQGKASHQRQGKVFLSTRRGTWLMQRLQAGGFPADFSYMSRFVSGVIFNLPQRLINKLVAIYVNTQLDHTLYGLRPKHGPLATHPTVNDELPNRIASGHVTMKPNVDCLTATGVQFDDGTFEDEIDTVVMATGYKISFPFLDQSLLTVEGNHAPLYLYMFPPSLAPPTLAVIGCVQPGGAIGPVSEMQCRLATRVFKGEVKLPSQEQMLQDINTRRQVTAKRYVDTPRHTIQTDFVTYMDELATLIGCKPDLGNLIFKDPRLAFACFMGPCTPYQYRLQGPGAWPEARATIMTQMDRVRFPFSTRRVEANTGLISKEFGIYFVLLALLLVFIYF